MPHAQLNDIKVYYEEHGKGDPLLLIAGFSCDSTHWMLVLEELAKAFRVIIFDNRGIGQTGSPDTPYSIEMMGRDTVALMDHLSIPAAHILGHSMGGCIAQTIAQKHPTRIKKLVLSNTLRKMNAVSSLALKNLLHLRQDNVSPLRLAEGVIPWIFSDGFLSVQGNAERIIGLMLGNPHPQTLAGMERQQEALLAFDSTQWCACIQAPTLVVGGGKDILCPDDAAGIAQAIPSSNLVIMPFAAHAPMIETPSTFNRIVTSYLLNDL